MRAIAVGLRCQRNPDRVADTSGDQLLERNPGLAARALYERALGRAHLGDSSGAVRSPVRVVAPTSVIEEQRAAAAAAAALPSSSPSRLASAA